MTTRTLTAEVTIAQMKAALLFIDKTDVVRGYLNGVCIDHTPKGTRMIATDGNRLIVLRVDETPVEGEPTKYVIGREILETVAKLHSKAVSVAVVWEQDSNPDPEKEGVTVVSVPRVTVAGIPTVDVQVVSGPFPDYTKVIPKKCSGKLAQFNPSYIMDCAKARKLFVSSRGTIVDFVPIAHNGDEGAMVYIADGVFAVVMPMRGDVEMTPPAWVLEEIGEKAAA